MYSNNRGSCPPKHDDRSCGRRKSKTTRRSGKSTFFNYCPVHTSVLSADVARLSYSLRRGKVDSAEIRRLRNHLGRLCHRLSPAPVKPTVEKKQKVKGRGKGLRNKPVKFVPRREPTPDLVPPLRDDLPLVSVSRRGAADLLPYTAGTSLESFGFQAYVMACDYEFSRPPYRRREKPFDDETYILSSADMLVQKIAVGSRRGKYPGKLVLKKPADVVRLIQHELLESGYYEFGPNYTLRRVKDVAEQGGFVGSMPLVGSTFMYVDGVPQLVSLS